jgi:AcrR family transcriptional regulator
MDDEPSPSAGARTLGRPRDVTIDERVLAATRQLLVEEGWEGTTIRGIAARAGVSRPAIARRWSSKAWLVMEAILGPAIESDLFADVDQDGWIRAVIDGSFELFRRPEVKAAVPGLLAALADSEELRTSLFSTFTGPPIDLYSEISAAERDPDARSVDARAFIVLAAGAALFSALIVGGDADERLAARVGELLERLAGDLRGS